MSLRVAEVALDARTGGAEAVYTYSSPASVAVGSAHIISIGPRQHVGFVIRSYEADPADLGFDPARLKEIGPSVEGLSLPAASIELADFVSRETLCPFPVALSLAMPPGIKESIAQTWEWTGLEPGANLPTAQDEVLKVLREGRMVEGKTKRIPEGTRKVLSALAKAGLAKQGVILAQKAERKSETVGYRLVADTAAVEAFLTGPGKKRPAQAITVMAMQGSESALTKQEIKALAGVTDQTVKALM
ncbi:MAG: hypothetical protein ABUL72_06850, partial [Armatimonadota bacterium]